MKLPRELSASAILGDVAAHMKIDRDELLRRLFG